jgi:putative aldouronate transport system permease protein
MQYHKSKSYAIFNIGNYVLLSFLALICLVPLIHVLAVAFSTKSAANANLVGLLPVGFTLDAFLETLKNRNFSNALVISIIRTVGGTGLCMAVVFLSGYALAKDEAAFKGRNVYSWIFLFTMLFSGGLVPTYITIAKMNLLNTMWALILPTAANVWFVILVLNFFRSLPKELEEAAFIDGAGHFRILFQIYLPISKPIAATIALFAMVAQWNSWFDGLIYMNDYKKYPLATFLQMIVVQQDFSKTSMTAKAIKDISQKTVIAAQIFIASFPVLAVYPFLQKFFVKGMILGSVKE